MTDSIKSLAERCRAIELLILDVDGVLTDGKIVYADQQSEIKNFHVRDGWALSYWRLIGKRSAIITGRDSPVVARRAAELVIAPVIQGAADKLAGLRRVLSETGLRAEHACCIGDDFPELPLLHNCGLAVAVADACSELIADAHYVTRASAGQGCVREVIELILRCQGHWGSMAARLRQQRL
jgi:3-deoxy-D-manno-octulosonate 8-phosphate phosphatase (KDO 8-P phosphatase)